MARSAERGQATRQRLLHAAFPLIAEVGWGSVTTRMVAERAGVNPGLVHYHFASVSDLLTAACLGVAREMLREMQEQVVAYDDAGRGLDWLLGELFRYDGAGTESRALSEAFLAASREPELREQLCVIVAEFRAAVAQWLRSLGHADAEASALVLAAVLDGLMMHRGLDPDLDVSGVNAVLRRMVGDTGEVRS